MLSELLFSYFIGVFLVVALTIRCLDLVVGCLSKNNFCLKRLAPPLPHVHFDEQDDFYYFFHRARFNTKISH